MKFLSHLTIAVMLGGLLVTTAPQSAYACSCMAQTPDELFAEGNIIFRGTVIGKDLNSETLMYSYAFEVDTVWQGPEVGGQVVQSHRDSATCGVNFEVGQEYVVVAQERDGQLSTGLCSYGLRDPETDEFLDMEEYLETQASVSVDGGMCQPYVCQNGDVHPACTIDGHPINYFAEPCHTSGGPAGEENPSKPGADQFSDVEFDHPSYEPIEWAREYGVVEGYSDGTFRPNRTVNRAEFVKILVEAYNLSTVALCRVAPFADTDLSEWYGPYVLAARCKGIVSGYPDNTFRPNQPINFVEAAKIIANLDAGTSLQPRAGEQWYEVYLRYMHEQDATAPSITRIDQLVTRGEMVEMMYRLQPVLPQEGPLMGVIERMDRPAEDIAYDFALVLDTPMRDPWSAMGPWAMVQKVPLAYSNEILFEDFGDYVGERVTLEGEMQWGYAESRVFAVNNIYAPDAVGMNGWSVPIPSGLTVRTDTINYDGTLITEFVFTDDQTEVASLSCPVVEYYGTDDQIVKTRVIAEHNDARWSAVLTHDAPETPEDRDRHFLLFKYETDPGQVDWYDGKGNFARSCLAVTYGYSEVLEEFMSTVAVREDSEQTFCTMDAKMCPDGSYVGRSGPKCEFEACPGER